MSNAQLSRMLFSARESIEMFADLVEAQTGRTDEYNRRLVAEIDEYRYMRGWSLHGFGGEDDGVPPNHQETVSAEDRHQRDESVSG